MGGPGGGGGRSGSGGGRSRARRRARRSAPGQIARRRSWRGRPGRKRQASWPAWSHSKPPAAPRPHTPRAPAPPAAKAAPRLEQLRAVELHGVVRRGRAEAVARRARVVDAGARVGDERARGPTLASNESRSACAWPSWKSGPWAPARITACTGPARSTTRPLARSGAPGAGGVAGPASASSRARRGLAVPGVAEQRQLAVLGQQVVEEAGHARDRVGEPGRACARRAARAPRADPGARARDSAACARSGSRPRAPARRPAPRAARARRATRPPARARRRGPTASRSRWFARMSSSRFSRRNQPCSVRARATKRPSSLAGSRPSTCAASAQFTRRVATARAFQLSRAKPGRPIVASALQLRISARQRSR